MAKTWQWDQGEEGPDCNGRPIRVVVSRWRWHKICEIYDGEMRDDSGASTAPNNWNGWSQGTSIRSILEPMKSCAHPNREGYPKRILQEGMNLHESHVYRKSGANNRLMHDPVVSTSIWYELEEINKRTDGLPVWHLVIRRDYKRIAFDVFIEEPRYNPKFTRRNVTFPTPVLDARFENAELTNMVRVNPSPPFYEINAGGVCEECAVSGNATCNLVCDENNLQGSFDYGDSIRLSDFNIIPTGANMIRLNLPNGSWIRLPIDFVRTIVNERPWTKVKIRPKL